MPIRGLQSQHRAMPQLTSHVCPSLAPPPPRPQLWIRCDVLPICPQSSSSNARLWWIRPRVSSLRLFLLHRGYRLRESGAHAGGRHEDHLRDSPPTSRETCSDQPRQPPPLLSSPDHLPPHTARRRTRIRTPPGLPSGTSSTASASWSLAPPIPLCSLHQFLLRTHACHMLVGMPMWLRP
jgi:hypothetical protein